MSNFKKHAHLGKCDVCGKETQVAVAASSMGPVSLSYCENCLAKGAEPYEFMVAYISCAGNWPEDINQDSQARVRSILSYLGKTEEEFATDVAAMVDKYETF
jgi:hypothetical protein